MTYHNIRLYPFDTEETDEEEIQLNESIRVSRLPFASLTKIDIMSTRTTFPSLLLALSVKSSLMASPCVVARTAGVLSMLRMRLIASLSTSGTSSLGSSLLLGGTHVSRHWHYFLRSHLQDLIETTAQIHYEAFRSKQLLALKEQTNARPAA